MESMENVPPSDHLAVIADAEAARDRLVNAVSLPSLFNTSIGAAVTVQIGMAAYGTADQHARGAAIAVGGVGVFLSVVGVHLARFRRLNGVRLSGLRGRVVGGTATVSSTAYLLAFGAAVWASFASQWLLVTLASVAGGVAHAVSGRGWWREYLGDPVKHARAESDVWMSLPLISRRIMTIASLAALVLAGAALVLVGR
jgi:hypothetical protein